ncbi:MAG: hypothetical protein IKE10_02755 [Bacilli bacterium]|nr:hypothetical protein [Bacilli bacterium]
MANWVDEMRRELCKDKMEFPQEFIDKALANFPDDEELKTLIEDKSFLLGDYLRKLCSTTISAEELSSASESGDMDNLVKKSNQINAAKELSSSFKDLYDEQYCSKGKAIKNGLVVYSPEIKLDYDIRHGIIKVHKVKIDPVYDRQCHEALVRRLEQNEARRIEGARRAGEYRCGGPGSF